MTIVRYGVTPAADANCTVFIYSQTAPEVKTNKKVIVSLSSILPVFVAAAFPRLIHYVETRDTWALYIIYVGLLSVYFDIQNVML